MEACELDKLKSLKAAEGQHVTFIMHSLVQNCSPFFIFDRVSVTLSVSMSPGKIYPAHEQKEYQANLALGTSEQPEEGKLLK